MPPAEPPPDRRRLPADELPVDKLPADKLAADEPTTVDERGPGSPGLDRPRLGGDRSAAGVDGREPDERDAWAEPATGPTGSTERVGSVGPAGSAGPATGAPARPVPSSAGIVRRTRISGTWVAVVVAAIVLVFLLVFILQNQVGVTVRFFGFSGTLPLGVALLFATIAGALLVALIGTARILQLRRRVRRIDH